MDMNYSGIEYECALCGVKFVPKSYAKDKSICPKCKAEMEGAEIKAEFERAMMRKYQG